MLKCHRHGRFQIARENLQPARADGAVECAVITGECDVHLRLRRKAAFILGRNKDRLARTDGEDRCARWVEDGREVIDAEHSKVGNREGRVGILFRCELLGSCAAGEIAHLFGDVTETFGFGVFDDRCDEAPVDGDGDTDSGHAVMSQRLAFEGDVHFWQIPKRQGGSFDDEIVDGDFPVRGSRGQSGIQVFTEAKCRVHLDASSEHEGGDFPGFDGIARDGFTHG